MSKETIIKELKKIPGVGPSIAMDLINIGITSISHLKNKDPDELYDLSNLHAGKKQDRCLLYVFRCAVYFATEKYHEKEKLQWWYWQDKKIPLHKK